MQEYGKGVVDVCVRSWLPKPLPLEDDWVDPMTKLINVSGIQGLVWQIRLTRPITYVIFLT